MSKTPFWAKNKGETEVLVPAAYDTRFYWAFGEDCLIKTIEELESQLKIQDDNACSFLYYDAIKSR